MKSKGKLKSIASFHVTLTLYLEKIMSKCISSRWKIGSRAVKKKATHMYSGFIELDMSTVTTVKPLLSGPPIKRTPSIKRTLSRVPKLTSYISLYNEPDKFRPIQRTPLLSGCGH